MFEDLIPTAAAQTPAPPPGLFDDLIPAGGVRGAAAGGISTMPGGSDGLAPSGSAAGNDPDDQTIARPGREEQLVPISGSPSGRNGNSLTSGLFDDLVPASAIKGVAGGSLDALAQEYEPVPDPSLGLKDARTGIPLVREFKPGRFIADITGQDDGGVYWKDPDTGEIRRQGAGELILPEGGKYKVYERQEVVRPWTLADMGVVHGIVSGFTAARDAFLGNMAPNEVIPRALEFAFTTLGGARTPVRAARPRANPLRPEPEPSPESTGPPPDQSSQPQNGAPSGAVSVFGDSQLVRLPSDRLAGRPKKRGRAPIGDDGYPVELHHHGQVQGGIVSEMTASDHRFGENFRKNHANTGQMPSLIDQALSRYQRYRHWAQELDQTRFDKLPELSDNQIQELRRATWERIRSQTRQSDE